MKTLQIDKGDFVIKNGRLNMVSGVERLRQNMMELFSIETLENGFGAGIVNFENLDKELVILKLKDAFNSYLKLQRNWRFLDTDERVTEIKRLVVESDGSNVGFEIVIGTVAGQEIELRGGM